MAKGRFVSKQITIDKKVNDLKDPWSMLGFTWMIPHADCEGRLYGDPSVLKSVIFPRQNGNISVEEVEKMACDWHNAGLVIYYEDDCDRYIQLVNFEKHQTGLRKDREPASVIPRFNPETCRIIAGLNRVKLSEVEVKSSKDESEEKSSGVRSIQRMIEIVVKLPPSGPADIMAMDEIEAMNPIQEDIQEAYNFLVGQGKRVTRYTSLPGCIRTAIAKRLQITEKPKKLIGKTSDGEVYE